MKISARNVLKGKMVEVTKGVTTADGRIRHVISAKAEIHARS